MRGRAAFVIAFVAGAIAALAPSDAEAQKKRQRDLVTRDEIMESAQREADLYAALRSLRPRFLERPTGIRTLGNSVQPEAVVVVDGKPMGDLATLRTITASSVAEVRYLEPSRAGTEYGTVATGGAVVVKLFRASKVGNAALDATAPKPDSTKPRPR